jgi:hypothetical protein
VHLLVCDNKWIFKMHGATVKIKKKKSTKSCLISCLATSVGLGTVSCPRPCCSIRLELTEPPKKATELTEVSLPVHNKLNIILNTGICLSYFTRKSQRLTSNWSIADRFAWHIGSCPWRGVLTDLTAESGSFWTEAATDCVLSMTEWLVSKVATRILIHTYKFRTANKTLPPLRIFVCRNPWHPFAEPC